MTFVVDPSFRRFQGTEVPSQRSEPDTLSIVQEDLRA